MKYFLHVFLTEFHKTLIVFVFQNHFFIFSDHFDALTLKIKKNYFDTFSSKKHFEKQ